MATATKQYEAMFLFGQAAAQDLDGAITQVRTIVERHGGEILVLKKWDERKLAYEIAKQKRGTYVICYYRGPGASVAAPII
jgi:small subunit ribosomal protein S6